MVGCACALMYAGVSCCAMELLNGVECEAVGGGDGQRREEMSVWKF